MITPFSIYKTKEDIIGLLDDDNKLVLPICKNILFISNKILNPDDDNFLVFEQDEAPIAGLYHKQVRLFDQYLKAYQENNPEICFILNRIIYEAYIKMRYLIDNPQDIKEYRELSYKSHITILENTLLSNTPNAKVFKRKFEDSIAVEGITIDEIKRARKNPGGKNFRQMQQLYESDALYSPIYGMTSDSIHSGWNEIRQMYLRCKKDTKQYVADVDFQIVLHYRLLISVADILISSSQSYYSWFRKLFPGIIPGLMSLLDEFKRMCLLISEVVIDTYKNNPDEYLYK